jgi:hypothetical protein
MITDTINSYPSSDNSYFTIESEAVQSSSSVNWSNFGIYFKYAVDTDSLFDFGTIAFSPDNGNSWIDLVNDPSYSQYLEWVNYTDGSSNPPVLTGKSDGWIDVGLRMRELGVY